MNHPYYTRETLQQHFDRTPGPSLWTSTTNDLLRAITIATDRLSGGESDVGIVVINVEACQNCEFYWADYLASKYTAETPTLHKTELLFRWEIPVEAVVVCLPFGRWLIVHYGTCSRRSTGGVGTNGRPSKHGGRVLGRRCGTKDLEGGFCKLWGAGPRMLHTLFGHGIHTKYIGVEVVLWWDDGGNIVWRALQGAVYPDCFDHRL